MLIFHVGLSWYISEFHEIGYVTMEGQDLPIKRKDPEPCRCIFLKAVFQIRLKPIQIKVVKAQYQLYFHKKWNKNNK